MTKLAIPTIHLNGTGRDTLESEYERAIHAVAAAQDAVRNITVHGRDYYTQKDRNALQDAQEQHARHLRELDEIHTDLQTILIGIQNQGNRPTNGITLEEYNRRWDMIMAAFQSGTITREQASKDIAELTALHIWR